ncbi:hypothetical protein PRIEUP_LOCUS459 [Pristimantis euphronides]
MLGSSVNLSCQMQIHGVKLERINLYWLIPKGNNQVEYLYPRVKRGNARSNNSWLVYPNFDNDLSLTVSNIQLSYTDTYICHTSLIIEKQNVKCSGNGTYLLVYEEFSTFMNHSDLICKVKVQAIQGVNLSWEFQGSEYNSIPSVIPTSDSSYWIISVWTKTSRCQTQQNQTFTCNLLYMGQSLVECSIEVNCAGDLRPLHSAPHPVLLYVLVLANAALILCSIVIIFLCMKKKQNRRIQVTLYAKFVAPSRTTCNS